MKQKYYILSALAAVCLTACSDEAIVSPELPQGGTDSGEYIQVGVVAGDDETRVAIKDEVASFSYSWEDDDTFTVFNASGNGFAETLFKIDEGQAGSNAATFTSTSKASFNDGETLYALYNGNQPVVWDEDGNITLDISDQDGTLTDKYQYMVGETTYDANGNNSFRLKHLVATLKVNIELPDGVSSISSVQLGNPYYNSEQFLSKATLVMKGAKDDSEGMFSAGDLVSNYNNRQYGDGTLKLTGKFSPASGNTVTVYLYVLPAQHYNDNSNWSNETWAYNTLLVKDAAGNEYIGTMPYRSRNIYQSDVLEMTTGLYKLEDFANESKVDGSREHPYEIANARQFYTFMFRSTHNLLNDNGYFYYDRSYYLSNDIDLNNEVTWQSCRIYGNTFDGKNHKIAGTIDLRGPLFGEIYNHCVLKNLVFDAKLSDEASRYYYSSLFTESVGYNSTIEHCINKSDLNVYSMTSVIAYRVYDRSSVIACGNEGTITSHYKENYICSLVNQLDYSEMNGCYDAGKHVYDMSYYTDNYFSGLVSYAYDYSTIKNSWSNCDYSLTNDNGGALGCYGINCSDMEYAVAKNCYWNGDNAATASQSMNGTYTNCDTFTGSVPTSAQIEAMNKDMVLVGYEFNTQGRIEKSSKTAVKPSEIEEW